MPQLDFCPLRKGNPVHICQGFLRRRLLDKGSQLSWCPCTPQSVCHQLYGYAPMPSLSLDWASYFLAIPFPPPPTLLSVEDFSLSTLAQFSLCQSLRTLRVLCHLNESMCNKTVGHELRWALTSGKLRNLCGLRFPSVKWG